MMQEFVQQIKDTVSEQLGEVHTAMPGRIVSVDTKSGTCTVLPMVRKKAANGTLMDYPRISGVPLVFPQGSGQGASVTYPVNAGDGCLVIVSEGPLDYWMYGRDTDTDLKFDITNAVCIPGLFQSTPSALDDACRGGAVIVEAGGARLTVSPSGVTVKGDLTVSGSVRCAGVDSSKDVTAGSVSLSGHTHRSGEPGSDTGKAK